METKTIKIYLDGEENENLLNRIPQVFNKYHIPRELVNTIEYYGLVMQLLIDNYDGSDGVSNDLYGAIVEYVDAYLHDFGSDPAYSDNYGRLFTDLTDRIEASLYYLLDASEFEEMYCTVEGILNDYDPITTTLLDINFNIAAIKLELEL